MFKLSEYNRDTDLSNVELKPKEAILAKCYECCVFQADEVINCKIKTCPLWSFKEKWFKKPRKIYPGDKRHNNRFHKYDKE